MSDPVKPCVWIIGFPRCGSASLCEALRILGWNPIHNPRHWDQLEGHDAAGDVFVTAHWRELYAMFPESKFIYNTRGLAGWLESLKRIPGFWESSRLYDRCYRLKVYGTHDVNNETTLCRRWQEHYEDVFKGGIRHEQILTCDSCFEPFSWKPLCEFLGMPVPGVEFPWLNRGHCQDARINTQEPPQQNLDQSEPPDLGSE